MAVQITLKLLLLGLKLQRELTYQLTVPWPLSGLQLLLDVQGEVDFTGQSGMLASLSGQTRLDQQWQL